VQHDSGLLLAVSQLYEISAPSTHAGLRSLVQRVSQCIRGVALVHTSPFILSCGYQTSLGNFTLIRPRLLAVRPINKLLELARHVCQLSALPAYQVRLGIRSVLAPFIDIPAL
jgi:hypothetical protein